MTQAARPDPTAIAALIDHTLLKPDATRGAVETLSREALQHKFASVCVNPAYVPLAAAMLRGSKVRVCAVAGFPLGAHLTSTKVQEAEAVIAAGASEVDMVIHVGLLKSGQDEAVEADVAAVVRSCHAHGAICKVILEMALLTEDEKVRACLLAKHAGADFVKTSTGFGPGGATVADVALMRRTVGLEMGVKAAGGIRTLDDLQKMVAAGATRIGSSAGIKILEEAASRLR